MAIFLAAGCGVAWALSAALGGEATWSVSTGVGAALAAGVYEVGRPARLSGAQASELDAQWADFRAFADARLARKGRCHASEVELAYRRFSPAYNARRRGEQAANAAGDADLRNFIANWSPAGAMISLRKAPRLHASRRCALSALTRPRIRSGEELIWLLQGHLHPAGGGAGGAGRRRELRLRVEAPPRLRAGSRGARLGAGPRPRRRGLAGRARGGRGTRAGAS